MSQWSRAVIWSAMIGSICVAACASVLLWPACYEYWCIRRAAGRLKSSNRDVRIESLQYLARLGQKAEPALDEIAKTLTDGSLEVRCQAAITLRCIGPASAPVVPFLAQRLNEDEFCVRMQVVFALKQIGPKAQAALPELVRELAKYDGAAWRRDRAFVDEALRIVDPLGAQTLRALIQTSKSGSAVHQLAAARFLGEGRPESSDEAVQFLVDLLSHGDTEEVRYCAAFALGEIGASATDALPALRAATQEIGKYLPAEASRAIEKIETQAATPSNAVLSSQETHG